MSEKGLGMTLLVSVGGSEMGWLFVEAISASSSLWLNSEAQDSNASPVVSTEARDCTRLCLSSTLESEGKGALEEAEGDESDSCCPEVEIEGMLGAAGTVKEDWF